MSLYLGNNLVSGVATPIQGARNIGQIIQSTIPITDAGLHLLDGALISGSGSYADFVTYIAGLVSTYPSLFETEANWQSAVTTYGVCGKFVYDSVNNTVRLPKITGFIEGTTDVTALGDLLQAGLPNITGTFNATGLDWASNGTSGAFHFDTSGGNNGVVSGSTGNKLAGFDASRSSSIYGRSSTVQPQSIKVLYYIVIATSTKTNIQVDIDEIATDLNGKADVDLSNVTSIGKETVVGWGMPDYTAGTSVSFSLNQEYTIPFTCFFNVDIGTNNLAFSCRIKNHSEKLIRLYKGTPYVSCSDGVFLEKGTVIVIDENGADTIMLYPLKGANQ